jgi:ABC-type bacteriocin/lantibiotic exporter with double-glycine peptidase domain
MIKFFYKLFPYGDVRALRRPLVLLFFFLFAACAASPDRKLTETVHTIKNVPFYPQEVFQCGPSSLSGVLNFYQVAVSPDDIAREIYSKSARGTLGMDMVLFAEKHHLKARQYKGSFQDIRTQVQERKPLIVMVDYGFWVFQQNHFMVVIGYDDHGVIVNSGREQFKFIPLDEFLQSWKKTEFWTLVVTPNKE